MCDLALLGAGLGIAQGVASVSAKQQAAQKNINAAKINYDLDQQQAQREYIIEKDASQKESHSAWLEMQRGKAAALASGGGFAGSTAGARVAEQGRQGALSISNAKDRGEAAGANYVAETKAAEIETNNYIATQRVDPLSAIFEIAGAGLSGYGQFAKI